MMNTELLMSGAVVCVIGLATVFAVLAILWGVLELMRVIFTAKKPAPKAPEKKAPQTPAPAPAPAPVAADDSELVAVLAAAVAAYLGQPTSSFRIRNYRRVAPIWNQTARRDNLNG